ncbi:MAG: hypothetical protein EHM59_18850 [Betaproteobacteria bacterium]|nr:MAG: hypothetical protein EHM59_18850 [Betaproteobacteria bacterium]
MTTTPIDEVVTLSTGELYKVIVRSYADIDIHQASSFTETFAYMYVDPLLTSQTPGTQVFVSPNLAPVPEPTEHVLMLSGMLCLIARYRWLRDRRARTR